MATITRITTQKKHQDRYNIFLDDGQGERYGFSVHEDVLIEYQLRKHMDLDDATMTVLINKDTLHKSYALAINFLSYRMRTKKEIQDYLVQKEVDEEHIGQIMDRLMAEDLIDDRHFADAFVRTRMNTSSKGPLLIRQELLQKGVDEAIAGEAINAFTFDHQYEKALKLARKKLSSGSQKSFRQQTQQLQGTLMQKGFAGNVVKDVMTALQNQKDDDAEWEALLRQGDKALHKHRQKYSGFELAQKVKETLYRKGFSFEWINAFLDERLDD